MKRILLAILCVSCTACSTRGQVDPDVMQLATAPLTCANQRECSVWWDRAHDWLTMHSHYPLEAATGTLLQTAGPEGGTRALAYQITRTANSDGTATIGFAAHCDSPLGCTPNPWEAGARFKQYVRTGTGQPDGKPDAPSAGAGTRPGTESDAVKDAPAAPPVGSQ